MKKIVLSIAMAAFLGLGLTSCDKDVRKCYKFVYEIEIAGAKTEVPTYEWCSANEADAKKDALEEKLGVKVTRTVMKSHKTAEDCIAANIEK
jgi:hypothetical protein